jgi:hypothetical protein
MVENNYEKNVVFDGWNFWKIKFLNIY